MPPDLVIRDGVFVTMGPAGVVRGDLAVTDGRIVGIGSIAETGRHEIDAEKAFVLPGLVQAHVHLCQTLFRGISDDYDVVDWLFNWVWPLEQLHDPDSMRASCRLGVAELLLSGTTTILSIESVRHTDVAFEAAAELGIRATIGKALMDRREPGTEMFGEDTESALGDLERLISRWHGTADNRLRVAVSPRGPRNATPELWRRGVALASRHGLLLHTHVNENRAQAELVALTGEGRDVFALDSWGALGPSLVMAHCVWPDDAELDLMQARRPHVCHCPSANLKLASGIAPIPEYLARGINVALGSDGAACNNNLDAFQEMRLAALIQKPLHGPTAMPAATVLELATLGGARALGLESEIGSLEPGKKADLLIMRPARVHNSPSSKADAASSIVYGSSAADVRTVLVDGTVVVRDGVLVQGDEQQIIDDSDRQRELILARLERRP
jgi:cytosine/adenosine deaminase-related metal-dependent hydrolase